MEKNKQKDTMLFTASFHRVYGFLRSFSIRYVAGHQKGLQRKHIGEKGELNISQAEKCVSLLLENGVISATADGSLHLHDKFYSMTMWDLLLICEPWMERLCEMNYEVHEKAEYDRFLDFMRSELLYQTYMEVGP